MSGNGIESIEERLGRTRQSVGSRLGRRLRSSARGVWHASAAFVLGILVVGVGIVEVLQSGFWIPTAQVVLIFGVILIVIGIITEAWLGERGSKRSGA
jgi:hypothetical protein